jgi:hypothetical protein
MVARCLMIATIAGSPAPAPPRARAGAPACPAGIHDARAYGGAWRRVFEIWQHLESGERYLMVIRGGIVEVAAGPLRAWDDPRWVLETHRNQEHTARALLHMRRAPHEYAREYTTGPDGGAVHVGEEPAASQPN